MDIGYVIVFSMRRYMTPVGTHFIESTMKKFTI